MTTNSTIVAPYDEDCALSYNNFDIEGSDYLDAKILELIGAKSEQNPPQIGLENVGEIRVDGLVGYDGGLGMMGDDVQLPLGGRLLSSPRSFLPLLSS